MADDEMKMQDIPEGGIIVESSVDDLEAAAGKLLVTFDTFVLTHDGCQRDYDGNIAIGESVVYRELIDLLPAELVCVNLGGGSWYLFVTYEVPESGFPTTRDAMKVAESEEKKMRILKDFLDKEQGAKITHVHEWVPDERVNARRILSIICDVESRFSRCD
ncbi:MAG: hypothetical protein ACTSYL_04190 [Candidatus Thorarchaeota archaeon]